MFSVILDNFSGHHGRLVRDVVEPLYDGDLVTRDLGVGSVAIDSINAEMAWVLDQAQAGAEVGAVNLSFGSSMVTGSEAVTQLYIHGIGDFHDLMVDLWNADVMVCLAAGNEASDGRGVSLIAATAFNMAVSAVEPGGEAPAGYSNWGAATTGAWASGDSGDAVGTSFSAPRMFAAFAEAKAAADLSNPEVLTLFEQTADDFVVPRADDDPYVGLRLDAAEMRDVDQAIVIAAPEIVDATYRVFLGRNPQQVETDYWVLRAERQGLEESVAALVGGTEEMWAADGVGEVAYMQRVKALYNGLLHREADVEGMGYWMEKSIEGGVDADWVDIVGAFTTAATAHGETVHHTGVVDLFLLG